MIDHSSSVHTAQLVEHCTGIAEGSNPVQAWIFLAFHFRGESNEFKSASSLEGLFALLALKSVFQNRNISEGVVGPFHSQLVTVVTRKGLFAGVSLNVPCQGKSTVWNSCGKSSILAFPNSDMYWTQLQVTGILWKLFSEQERSRQLYFYFLFWDSRVGHCNKDPETPNKLLWQSPYPGRAR